MEDFYYNNLLFHLITSFIVFSVWTGCKNTKVTIHPLIILWPNREVGLNHLLLMEMTNATNISLLSLSLTRNSNLKIILLTHFQIFFSFYPHSLDIKKHFKKLEEIMLRASSDPFSTIVMSNVLQTLFSLYLHNQYTDFHKLSCARKPQMRAICTYMGCTKATTND